MYIQSGRLHGRLRLLYCIYRIVYHLFYLQRVRSCKRLVTCHRVPCSFTGRLQGRLSSQGFAGKVILGESGTASSSDLSKCLVTCSIFNGRQGGRLSHCHRIIMYMYFSLWILVSRCF